MKRDAFRLLVVFVVAAPLVACGGEGSDLGFASSGMSRGTAESLSLAPSESYAGQLNEIEVAVLHDPASGTFVGRLRNEATTSVCDVRVDVVLDGTQAVNTTPAGVPLQIAGLSPLGRQDFTFAAGGVPFSAWTVRVESFTCSSASVEGGDGGGEGSGEGHGPEGSGGEGSGGEGSGGEGAGGEGSGGEGAGGEGAGGEGAGGDESSPAIPLMDPFSGVFNNLDFAFAYDATNNAFRGVVENRTSQLVCLSRVEVHVGVAGQVIELGPTIGLDLAPDESLDVVLEPAASGIDTYTLHPEASPCP